MHNELLLFFSFVTSNWKKNFYVSQNGIFPSFLYYGMTIGLLLERKKQKPKRQLFPWKGQIKGTSTTGSKQPEQMMGKSKFDQNTKRRTLSTAIQIYYH